CSAICSSACWTGGTTLEIATASMSAGVMPRVRRMASVNTPYSSAVCSRRVVSVHETSTRSPSHTPILVLVLPTSITRSIWRQSSATSRPREGAGSGQARPERDDGADDGHDGGLETRGRGRFGQLGERGRDRPLRLRRPALDERRGGGGITAVSDEGLGDGAQVPEAHQHGEPIHPLRQAS